MTRDELDKMLADFNQSRKMPGKRLLSDLYESGESGKEDGSDEEAKGERKRHKRLKPATVSDE